MINSNEPITDALLDRLVEDELDATQRRKVIATLEDEPDGWRRCALAFLENQTWRQSFRQFVGDASLAEKSVLPTKLPNGRRTGSMRNWAAVSVIIVFALAVGVGIGRGWSAATSPIADQSPSPDLNNDGIAPAPSLDQASPKFPGDSKFQLVGFAKFSDGDNSNAAMPILSGSTLGEDAVYEQPMPLSAYELQRLERKGWKVRQTRQVVTVELADGQRISIPIDAVNYQFVGQEIY